MFYLYHTRNGWLTRSSTFTSDVELAMEFNETEAITVARRFKSGGKALLLPVRVEDMESL